MVIGLLLTHWVLRRDTIRFGGFLFWNFAAMPIGICESWLLGQNVSVDMRETEVLMGDGLSPICEENDGTEPHQYVVNQIEVGVTTYDITWHRLEFVGQKQGPFQYHDDVIKWKHFPRYWPFVRGIHRSPVNSSHKRPVTRTFDVFFAQWYRNSMWIKHSRVTKIYNS